MEKLVQIYTNQGKKKILCAADFRVISSFAEKVWNIARPAANLKLKKIIFKLGVRRTQKAF